MAIAFLEKILSLFGGGDDPESGKKKLLKQLTKDLSKNKYARFYKVKGEAVEPPFAKFFYDMYKIVSPAQVFLQNAAKSEQLKQITIEFFMDKKLLSIQERLSKEAIEERAKTVQTKELARQLREELSQLVSGFDNTRIKAIDDGYNLIMAFNQFVNFDFFFLLKKFDANMSERNFTYQPKFEAIRAEYITEDIKDFLEIAYAVDPDQDWKTAMEVLKNYKGDIDVVSLAQWNKLLVLLRDIKRSKILELMVRQIDKDPYWQSLPRIPDEHIVEPFLDKKKSETEGLVNRILNDKRNAQLEQLAKAVFGTADVERMKYYTDKNNEIYLKKGMDGFTHAQGLNYLKAFLLDFFKRDIRELCDLFLIRGQWASPILSQQMSEGFHTIMGISEEILAFDEALSDNGENGSRLKAALAKVDRDKGQAKYIRIILKSVNEEAQKMIILSAQALIVIGKHFKGILEDYQKNPHELIMNWKEIESTSEEPIAQRITEVYKKIYYFIQMMQFFARPAGENGEE
ncbi:DUF5312 family protein [Breznakiella homolactica]|uniref:Uncharacterized protein n=1 Tax=Breznakiella homolactica TaxID=2798577 RepID=A0A7T8BBU9_9SPIR|nr:DUF5312 family protein [Breznakiella homolactica]QQO10761.1 DUF5312 domain-containing protein [Breznakiella homolactica]